MRRAIAYAIDRKAIIDGAQDGFGAPIGSHLTPNDPGYVDLTGKYPHDPAKSKALLKEAGVTTPLQLSPDLAAAALRTPGRRDHRGAARRMSESTRRSKTSNGRNGCPASTRTRTTI